MRSTSCLLAALALLLGTLAAAPARAFVEFESGQVRPLALSPDGTRLYAVNTPDDQLEIFAVSGGGLAHLGSVPVGMEPVAVAARSNTEVWVVNHLSDSISIVDVGTNPARVVRTLLVGDEPRDIVFAGPGGNRAFITAAHRGQNRPGDPQLTTPGVGRADVWVFDATNLGATLGGTPLTIVTLFGDTPRALAASTDGSTVYAAVFQSGNRTTALNEGAVCNGGQFVAPCNVSGTTMPGGLPNPSTNFQGTTRPEVGLIVKFNAANNHWEDQLARNWNPAVRFSLPDKDVFAINANAPTPAETGFFTTVGTTLFNMAVNPVSGKVYVSNTDAHNEVRFEGPGTFGGSTVRGHLAEARISVLSGATVTPRHLNKQANLYTVVPSPPGVKDASLATPTGIAVTSDGATLYVAGFGSSKVGKFSTAALENDTFTSSAANLIAVSGGGPSGLVLDEAHSRLYVMTRFDNAISVINTSTAAEVAHLPVHNPEPANVVNGRPFLYDALLTSSNGEAACASCHIFGDFDSLAWDLGNPDDIVKSNFNPFRVTDPLGISFVGFHPMKGPMTTQSLRGMATSGPMHWRGDRTGAAFNGDPNALNENLAFKAFNVAFDGLLGRGGPLTDPQMQSFTDFILQVTYPPNPIRALDNSLTPDQTAGRNFFMSSAPSDIFQPCHGCHALTPASGFFGTDGFSSFENETQFIKIPHLRNMYQKVGMFGMPAVSFVNAGDNGNKSDQIRGFGFLHDGSVDTLFRFHNAFVFNQTVFGFPNPGGFPNGAPGDTLRRQVEQFMLAFDSNLAPIVGQQITLTGSNGGVAGPRIDLMIARAAALECEVVVKGTLAGEQRGWLRNGAGLFRSDRTGDALLTDAQLRTQTGVAGQERTYTCAPPGSGTRMGIDRDGDGFLDRDEIDAGSDPADPGSIPGGGTTTTSTSSTSTTTVVTTTTTTSSIVPLTLIQTKALTLRDRTTPSDPTRRRIIFRSATRTDALVNRIVPPTPGGPGDPISGGGFVEVYNSAAQTNDHVNVALPAAGWSALGTKGFRFSGNTATGPVWKVIVKPDLLVVKGGKSAWTYTLNEASQGSVALRVVLGAGAGWCANALPKSPANLNDTVDKFVARRVPAPASCPPTGSPSGAFLE